MIQSTEYVVIACYLLMLIAVSLVFKNFNKNISDYFRNGCRGKWWLVGASAFMTSFSAWTFTGASGVAYEAGWSVLIIFMANALGYLLNALFLAPWFRQIRAISPPEVIRKRFGVETQQFYAYMSVITMTLYASLHLYGLSIFTSAVFGLDISRVIIVIGVVVLIYSYIGGSWAVMATDFLQCFILLPMTVLIALLCINYAGGLESFMGQIKAAGLSADFTVINTEEFKSRIVDFTLPWALAMMLKNVLTYNTLVSASRYFSVKDGREARKAAWMAFVMTVLGSFVWFIPPVTARLYFSELVNKIDISKPAEAAYAVASLELLPVGMTGLIVVAMFAATMSSMDSGLNRNAAILTNDILPAIFKLLKKKLPDGRMMLIIGQVLTVIPGVIIICLALYFASQKGQGIFKYMLDIGALLALPMTTPMLMGLLIRKAPWWSALVSVLVAFCGSLASLCSGSACLGDIGFMSEPWKWYTTIFVNFGLGVVAYLLTVPFWHTATEKFRAQVDEFFKNMYTPVDFAKEVGEDNDGSQQRVMGIFSVIVGLGICLIMTVTTDSWTLNGRLGVLFVGGSVVVIGLLLLYAAGRSNKGKH